MSVVASAPSNIALIKYMGKTSSSDNLPTNASLSYTLDNLRTFVRITPIDEPQDRWQALVGSSFMPLTLNEKSQQRFLKHFQNLKIHFKSQDHFLIESANNFPSDCGLASSASSFAALTMGAFEVFGQKNAPLEEQAEFSRQGSGSSCRSFFGPFCLWSEAGVRPIEFPTSNLIHQVAVVEGGKKAISSSEAHQRVLTSSMFKGRVERAEDRLQELTSALKIGDWPRAFEITWAEFWDMHALFETSAPPFGYMQSGSLEVLRFLADLWTQEKDGPLVTMDAGANVHLLYRVDQASLAKRVKTHFAEFIR